MAKVDERLLERATEVLGEEKAEWLYNNTFVLIEQFAVDNMEHQMYYSWEYLKDTPLEEIKNTWEIIKSG